MQVAIRRMCDTIPMEVRQIMLIKLSKKIKTRLLNKNYELEQLEDYFQEDEEIQTHRRGIKDKMKKLELAQCELSKLV